MTLHVADVRSNDYAGGQLDKQTVLQLCAETIDRRIVGLLQDHYTVKSGDLRQKQEELQRLNSRLDRANERLKHLDQAKSRFVATATHELRTPLTTILGMIQIILALDISPTDERKEAYLRIVERETRRLSNLVEILLSISRLEAGRDVLHRSRFAVGELARIVKDSIRLPEDREVSISITGKDNPEAYADRRQIGLVIRNILENAVRYTPDGGVVEIIISRVRGRVIMGIKDQGPGIPPEQQELIFERFYRIREDRSTAGKGSGLGLSVAWEIIKAHNEKIWLESSPGQGSTFYFSLPESEETLHPAGTGHGHRQQAESGHE